MVAVHEFGALAMKSVSDVGRGSLGAGAGRSSFADLCKSTLTDQVAVDEAGSDVSSAGGDQVFGKSKVGGVSRAKTENRHDSLPTGAPAKNTTGQNPVSLHIPAASPADASDGLIRGTLSTPSDNAINASLGGARDLATRPSSTANTGIEPIAAAPPTGLKDENGLISSDAFDTEAHANSSKAHPERVETGGSLEPAASSECVDATHNSLSGQFSMESANPRVSTASNPQAVSAGSGDPSTANAAAPALGSEIFLTDSESPHAASVNSSTQLENQQQTAIHVGQSSGEPHGTGAANSAQPLQAIEIGTQGKAQSDNATSPEPLQGVAAVLASAAAEESSGTAATPVSAQKPATKSGISKVTASPKADANFAEFSGIPASLSSSKAPKAGSPAQVAAPTHQPPDPQTETKQSASSSRDPATSKTNDLPGRHKSGDAPEMNDSPAMNSKSGDGEANQPASPAAFPQPTSAQAAASSSTAIGNTLTSAAIARASTDNTGTNTPASMEPGRVPSSSASATELIANPGTGSVQVAQILNRATQAEMKIGMNTSAFGSVEVRAVVHATDVGVVIGSERGDLHSLLTNDLPGIANLLQQQNLRLSQVSFTNGLGVSTQAQSQGDARSGGFRSPVHPSSPAYVESGRDTSGGPASMAGPRTLSGGASISILA